VKCYDLRCRRRKYTVFLRLLNIFKLTNSCDDPFCEIGENSSFHGTGRFLPLDLILTPLHVFSSHSFKIGVISSLYLRLALPYDLNPMNFSD
jgi:hypothetical protein